MYQLLLSFLLIFFSCFSLTAQVQVFEVKVGWKTKILTMNTISDRSKMQTCTILSGPDSLLAWYFADSQLVKPINAGWSKVKGELLAGGFIRNSEAYFFLENEEKTSLRAMKFNPSTGLTDEHTINLDFGNESIIDRISSPDRLLYFTVSKKKRQIVVYDFYCDSAFRTVVFKPTEDVWLALNNGRVNNGKTSDVKVVNPDFGAGADVASKKNKIYIKGDSVLLVIDPVPGYTRIFHFNFETQNIQETSVFHKAVNDPIETPRVNHNTIMLDDRLYYACATRDSFLITCYSLPGLEILFDHRYSSKNLIDFKSSELVFESGVLGKPANSTDKINNTRKYLRKLMDGNLFLSVEKASSGIHNLTIGAYNEIKTSGGGYYYGGPSVGFTSMGSFVRTSLFQSAYFNVLVYPENGTKAPGIPNMPAVQRAETYSRWWKEVYSTENIFKKGNSLYYAFYDRSSRKIIFAIL